MSTFYRLLLRLYPASFRANYGEELERAFLESTRAAGRAEAVLAAIADVVPNAFLVHWDLFRQDARYTARSLRRAPSFSLTVILVTAIGVGANVATFTVADHVLLRPLPFPDPDALVRLCEGPLEGAGWGCMNELSPANARDVAQRARSFASLGVFAGTSMNVVGAGDPTRVVGAAVSPEVLVTLGVGPAMGRLIETGDVEGTAVVLVSDALWQEQFGADQGIVGRAVSLNGVPHVVIGVMPPSFIFPSREARLWTPLRLTEENYLDRTDTYLQSVARLRDGATFEQARAELSGIFGALAREFPETNAETGFSFFRQRDQMSPRYKVILLALSGASLSLLLLAMANLGSLHLTRLAGRERELAVRTALGAGRERLARQLITESLLLAAVGGLIGLLVALGAVPLLAHLVPSSLPLAAAPTIDLRVLLLGAALATSVGLVLGLIPVSRAGRSDLFGSLRAGVGAGSRRQRLRQILVSAEVAITVVLLTSSGFLIRAVWRVQDVDPGFVSEGALTLRTALSDARYSDPATYATFLQRVLEEVRTLPGVEAAGYTSGLPMVLTGGITGVSLPGEAPRPGRVGGDAVSWRIVSAGYFAALGVSMREGRDFGVLDDTTRVRVAVVSESFALRYWPGQDAIGRQFGVRGETRTVVGVVRDIRVRGPERANEPQLYVPFTQLPPNVGELYLPKDLVVRAAQDPMSLVPAVREIVRRIDPGQPISDVRALGAVVEAQTADRVAQVRVLGALAIVALLLTAVGIQGLLAFSVAQRSREIGLRLALGSEPRRVAALVVGEAARLALLGGIPGLAIAFAAVRSMQSMLFGLEPADPAMLAGAALIVVAVAVGGSIAPAVSAARVSPMEAMRAD